jgi:hypothetical protein
MEAMSYGVAPLVSDVGGMPEMVLEGQAGVVLADHAPETLRDTIAGLLDAPQRRATLGRRARRRVEEDLDVERTANRLLDIVRDVSRGLAGPSPRHGPGRVPVRGAEQVTQASKEDRGQHRERGWDVTRGTTHPG